MADSASFSVVIAAYTAAATIGSAIDSALRQTEPAREVIVVDDGSTDATGAVVAALEDPRIRLVSQANQGMSGARNAGIALAQGSYVTFLDSDDLLLPRYLERARQAVSGVQRIGFAYTDAFAFQGATGRIRKGSAMHGSKPPAHPPPDPAGFLLELLKRNFVYNATTVPLKVLTEVGGFDDRRTGSEDYDLWLRIVTAGFAAVRMPGFNALYRIHPGQTSRDEVNLVRNMLEIYESLSPQDMPSEAHRHLLTQRRAATADALRVLRGELPIRSAALRLRRRLAAIRRRLGLGTYAWEDLLPPEVAAAYPDLAQR